ncbi:MAG: GPW/gp25 family protein [Pseudomonadota bacterium]
MDDAHRFLGRGWAFPPRFSPDGAQMVGAGDDIAQSLHVLLSTLRGERVMRPDYGFGLQEHSFAHMDRTTLTEIRYLIEEAVRAHEPRIVLEVVHLTPATDGAGRLDIELTYKIPATNSRSNIVFPFYYQEGTSVPTQERIADTSWTPDRIPGAPG